MNIFIQMNFPVNPASKSVLDDITLEDDAEPGLFEELLAYLQAISNPVRLEIILYIEKNPRSVKEIARYISSNYDNTKKHIDKLMTTGIIKKEEGIGEETSKGSLPVWKYSLIPGGMESVIRSLNSFSNLNLQIVNEMSEEFFGMYGEKSSQETFKPACLCVLGGEDDGRSFHLLSDKVAIGRASPGCELNENSGIIVLSGSYQSVTRIGSSHALVRFCNDGWYLSDLNSTNGSFVNHSPLMHGKEVKLNPGDIIDLGRGPTRARLVFLNSGNK